MDTGPWRVVDPKSGGKTKTLRGVLMSGRPEGSDNGGYHSIEPVDQAAWQDFTPWRPGDKATERAVRNSAAPLPEKRLKWTEEQPDSFDVGDRIGSTKPLGGILGSAVPAGSIGEVVSTRLGLFEETVTVKFDNGYTAADIKPSDIEHKGWF
ncbi:MAG TPA: hypothetical protein VHX38_35715 [Pseudonocardiaceae bacterium]|nr:hypothetical protein [Pseudonocardiaceae bacterium]